MIFIINSILLFFMHAMTIVIGQVQENDFYTQQYTHIQKRSPLQQTSQIPCPGSCQCKWSNGKPSAFCDNRDLISLPQGIDSEIQVLDASKNNFQTLPSRVFQERKLTNLQRINLSSCRLNNIVDDTFLQLTNLVELDLSTNLLLKIPTQSTKETKQLRKLYLSHNPITSIEANAFSALTELIVLDISFSMISSIESGAFHGLINLKELKLNDNHLTTLGLPAVVDLPPNIYIDLTSNPWNCDCNLRLVREWYANGGIQNNLPPTCAKPAKIMDTQWTALKSEDLACAPELIHGNTNVVATVGSNTSLSCNVRASLPHTFVWFQDEKNRISSRNNKSVQLYTTRLLEERRYDIYETIGSPDNSNISASVLTLHNLRLTDSSTFLCWVENKAGYSVLNFTLTVIPESSDFNIWHFLIQHLLIFVVLLISLTITVIISLLVFRRKKVVDNDLDKKFKPSRPIKHSSMSSMDMDDEDSTSTDSSAKEPQISSIGLNVIEHMKTGIISMDYHSMSPIIQFNNVKTNQHAPTSKSTTEELHIQQPPDFGHLPESYNNLSADSSYNCDLTSSSTTGYHSDYNSGYSDELNSANNYNVVHNNNHLHNNIIPGMTSTLDRQQHLAYLSNTPHYNSIHHIIQQPPDVTIIHSGHQRDSRNIANVYSHDLPSDMAMVSDI